MNHFIHSGDVVSVGSVLDVDIRLALSNHWFIGTILLNIIGNNLLFVAYVMQRF